MSSHSDSDRERRAREEAEARRAVLDLTVADRSVLVLKMPRVLDAYAEAVRQAERDRMARVVEGLRDEHNHWCAGWKAYTMHELDCDCGGREHNAVLARVLTALAAPPEGKTDG